MSTDITDQLAGWMDAAERTHDPITVDELMEGSIEPATALRTTVETTDRRRAWAVMLTAAAVLMLVVVGVVVASSPEPETPFVTTPPTLAPVPTTPTTDRDDSLVTTPPTTSSATGDADPLPLAEGTVIEETELPRLVEGLEPFGATVVEGRSGPSEFWLSGFTYGSSLSSGCFGGVVETPVGYTALGYTSPHPMRQAALATSTDGLDWSIVEGDTDPTDEISAHGCARLFEAGGWYWIGVNDSVIYRSADTVGWEAIDTGNSAGPMGIGLTDQRWHEFDGRLVGMSVDGVVSVDMTTGVVGTHARPPELTPDAGWLWMTAVDGELTAFGSTDPWDYRWWMDIAPRPVQYSTTDLETWSGPTQPILATDQGDGLLLAGDTARGLVAYEMEDVERTTRRYFSDDGLTWRRLRLIGEPQAPEWGPHLHVGAVRVGGKRGVAHLDLREPVVYLSTDGTAWQQIRLHDDDRVADTVRGIEVSDNTIFYYEIRTADDGSPLLASWRITFEP